MPFALAPLLLTCTLQVTSAPELLVSGYNSNALHRFDATTGAFLGFVVPGNGGVIDGGTWLAWLPDQRLHLTGPWPPVGGTPFSLQLGLCPGDWIGLVGSALVVSSADAEGRLVLSTNFGPGLTGATVHLQAYDVLACRPSVPRGVVLLPPGS